MKHKYLSILLFLYFNVIHSSLDIHLEFSYNNCTNLYLLNNITSQNLYVDISGINVSTVYVARFYTNELLKCANVSGLLVGHNCSATASFTCRDNVDGYSARWSMCDQTFEDICSVESGIYSSCSGFNGLCVDTNVAGYTACEVTFSHLYPTYEQNLGIVDDFKCNEETSFVTTMSSITHSAPSITDNPIATFQTAIAYTTDTFTNEGSIVPFINCVHEEDNIDFNTVYFGYISSYAREIINIPNEFIIDGNINQNKVINFTFYSGDHNFIIAIKCTDTVVWNLNEYFITYEKSSNNFLQCAGKVVMMIRLLYSKENRPGTSQIESLEEEFSTLLNTPEQQVSILLIDTSNGGNLNVIVDTDGNYEQITLLSNETINNILTKVGINNVTIQDIDISLTEEIIHSGEINNNDGDNVWLIIIVLFGTFIIVTLFIIFIFSPLREYLIYCDDDNELNNLSKKTPGVNLTN